MGREGAILKYVVADSFRICFYVKFECPLSRVRRAAARHAAAARQHDTIGYM